MFEIIFSNSINRGMVNKLFAIVGYTDWGKSHTLYTLFKRRQFFPLKSPIVTDFFRARKFTVVNASNEDKVTEEYLKRLTNVLSVQKKINPIFVITVSLIFNDGPRDVKEVFEYLNSLKNFEVHFVILEKGWYKGSVLLTNDLDEMKKNVFSGRIHIFSEEINESVSAFEERTLRIAKKMAELISDNDAML